MECPACTHRNPENARFCAACGAAIAAAPKPGEQCGICGARRDAGATFCVGCGNRLPPEAVRDARAQRSASVAPETGGDPLWPTLDLHARRGGSAAHTPPMPRAAADWRRGLLPMLVVAVLLVVGVGVWIVQLYVGRGTELAAVSLPATVAAQPALQPAGSGAPAAGPDEREAPAVEGAEAPAPTAAETHAETHVEMPAEAVSGDAPAVAPRPPAVRARTSGAVAQRSDKRAPAPAGRARGAARAGSVQAPADGWRDTLRRELRLCAQKGAIVGLYCRERVRWRHCAGRWDSVPECSVGRRGLP